MTIIRKSDQGPTDLMQLLPAIPAAKKAPAKVTAPVPRKPAADGTLPGEPASETPFVGPKVITPEVEAKAAKVNRHADDPRVQAVKEHFETDASDVEIYEVVKKALTPKGAITKYDLFLNPSLATVKFDTDPRVIAVKEHATANFEQGGWDIVSETMTSEDIYEVVKKTRTPAGAIQKMAAHVGVVDEVRADIIAAGDPEA